MKRLLSLFVAVLVTSLLNAQNLEGNAAAKEILLPDVIPSVAIAVSSLPTNDGKIVEFLGGKTLYEAHIKNKKLNGRWQSWYENGALCDSGTFVKGLPDGEWKYWDVNGQLIALRTYSADKYNRINNELVRYNPKRPSFPLTLLYQKNKRAALKYFHASYSFTGGIRNKEDLSLSQLIAANITPGNFYQPVFDHSLHHGLYVNYFADGIVKDSGYYKNGLRHGIWIHRETPAGFVQRGFYENGTKVKGWRNYDTAGKLVSMTYYTKGRVSWQKAFR